MSKDEQKKMQGAPGMYMKEVDGKEIYYYINDNGAIIEIVDVRPNTFVDDYYPETGCTVDIDINVYNNEFTEGAGLKGAIDLKTSYLIVKYFTKDINKEISNIKVKDQKLSISSINCRLTNLNFGISNYSHEKVQIFFEPSSFINIYLKNINYCILLRRLSTFLW